MPGPPLNRIVDSNPLWPDLFEVRTETQARREGQLSYRDRSPEIQAIMRRMYDTDSAYQSLSALFVDHAPGDRLCNDSHSRRVLLVDADGGNVAQGCFSERRSVAGMMLRARLPHRVVRATLALTLTGMVLVMPQAPGTAATSQPLALTAISFPDPKDGWVADVVGSGTTILRTVDSGRHWTSARVPWTARRLDFVDTSHGWAIATGPPGCVSVQDQGSLPPLGQKSCRDLILATQDGGQRWSVQLTAPRDSWLANLQLLDDTHGWVVRYQSACPTCLAYVHILATTDGGATWQPLRTSLPIAISSLVFATPQQGFATGIVGSNDPNVYTCSSTIFATDDGGQTWHRRPPLAQRCGEITIHFRTATDGWAFSSFVPEYDTDKLYHTTDGGVRWRLVHTRSLWNQTGFPEDVIFASPEVGWVPFSPGAKAIAGGVAITTDGGRRWKRYLTSYETAGAAVTTKREGWLIGHNRLCPALSCSDDLLHTTDAGHSWKKIVPAIVGSSAP